MAALRFSVSGLLFCMSLVAIPLRLAEANDKERVSAEENPQKEARLTEEECEAFADSVTSAVADNDVKAFNKLIDWDSLVDSATSGFSASPVLAKVRSDFKTGVLSTVTAESGLCGQILKIASEGGQYKFLRSHSEGKQQRCLFRLLLAGSGVNYHDFVLQRTPGGSIVAIDVFVYMSGELFSQTLGREFTPLAATAAKGTLGRLAGLVDDRVIYADKVLELLKDHRAGRHSLYLENYKKLPESLRKTKNLLMLRVLAAQATSEEEYAAAMDDFRRYHPKDVCLDFVMIDHSVLKKDYTQALKSIDRIDQSVGGDPSLNIVRANVLSLDQKLPAARQAAEKAVQQEPDLLNAHWMLVSISLSEKKFDDTLLFLRRIKATFPVEFGDLTKIPDYAEFVKTPQYQEWLKTK